MSLLSRVEISSDERIGDFYFFNENNVIRGLCGGAQVPALTAGVGERVSSPDCLRRAAQGPERVSSAWKSLIICPERGRGSSLSPAPARVGSSCELAAPARSRVTSGELAGGLREPRPRSTW